MMDRIHKTLREVLKGLNPYLMLEVQDDKEKHQVRWWLTNMEYEDLRAEACIESDIYRQGRVAIRMDVGPNSGYWVVFKEV